jgi:hypothetical protein
VLTLTEISNQHDLSIRELERIVVHFRVLEVDLAEASHFVRQFPGGQKREPSVAFDFFFEYKFCPWQQADGYARLPGITEAALMDLGKCVVTSLSPTLAGRDATK